MCEKRKILLCFAEYAAFVLLLLLSVAGMVALFLFLRQGSLTPLPSFGATDETPAYHTVILDAGHGGEDGGAIGHIDGREVYEKDINLAITLTLRDLLEAEGINVILTREKDVLLYDRNTDYQGRKKVLDLAARLHVGQSTPGALFVSIHMNAFTQAKYHGLQVYYSPNHALSQTLAAHIQDRTQEQLQPDNHRHIKKAGSDIFLLEHLKCPAVLVECGFLSNEDECRLLEQADYQQKLAFLLFCAIRQALCEQTKESAPLWSKVELFADKDLIFDKKYRIIKREMTDHCSKTEDTQHERNQNHLYLLGMRNEEPQVAGQMPLLRRVEFLC
ncbi:MAG: N-acetylmuramoyl-L-alanine amidase [Ruminococcaceae bacterium]|nr:N-acetylmuramoyl-L-alanine amidase [Oscillospiraceae bacterium]